MEENKGTSPIKLCLLLASIVIIIIIIILTISSISISKKSVKDATLKKHDDVVLVDKNKSENNKTKNEDTSKNNVNVNKTSEKDSEKVVSKADKSDNSNSEESSSDKVQSDIGSFIKVEKDELNSTINKTSVVVSGKGIYKVDDLSFTYCLNLIFPNGEDFCVVKYFCSKKSYDAVSVGDTITAEYQTGRKGLISVRTITK